MQLELDSQQRAHLELISMHTGKPAEQVLVDAAAFLLDRDAAFWASLERTSVAVKPQQFLADAALDARFAQVLGR